MKNLIIQRLKSKTYWAAIIMAVLAGVEASEGFLTGFISPGLRPWALMAFPLAMVVLRELTTTALADK